jgi:hypothetical protein
MTTEDLDAFEKLANFALSSLTAQATVNAKCRAAVPALVVEVRRLREALAAVAAPLSPTVEDLWTGVLLARRVLNGGER